ncbi:MAG TPA: methyltransferase domain-containing protein [Candidatus Sulfotelmatobacter sp.]
MIQKSIPDVQSGYDSIADEYAHRIYDELRHKPRDRELLDRFAESVRDGGVVCDLGCGPGQVARYLQGRGIQVCGVDLSEGMLERARQLNQGIDFHQGDMRALPFAENAWAGIAAFYAIVNLSLKEVADAVRQMWRVLQPGGQLLLSFHLGEDVAQLEEDIWGCGVCLEFTFFRASTILGYMREAGFEIDEVIERDPYAPDVEYQSRRAYIFAHKPETIS